MADKVYADGIRTFPRKEQAPEWVLGTLIITPNDLFTWCKANEQYMSDYEGKKQLRLQVAKGDQGKINISVDTWKPDGSKKAAPPVKEDTNDLPF